MSLTREFFMKKLKEIEGLVSMSVFGSYGTEYWVKDRSDIDLAVVVAPNITTVDTFKIEDNLEDLCKEYYKYEKIHLTFILFNEFYCKYARLAVDSNEIYVNDEDRWYDFNHYVLKYVRQNKEFEKKLKIDEQFSYFGGIIDESLL